MRDAGGEEVRRLEGLATEAGLHRKVWDLRGERSPEVKLRTRPNENPRLPLPEEGWRPLSDGGRFSRLQPPGVYTIQLVRDEVVLSSRELTVLADPASGASAEDLAEQTRLLTALEKLIVEAAGTINQMESVRRQLLDLETTWSRLEREDLAELTAEAPRLERAVAEVEGVFFDLRLTGARQDTLRWKRLLYSRLTYLARRVGQSDHRPTDAQRGVFAELERQMSAVRERWTGLLANDLEAFNRDAARAGLGVVSW